MTTEIRADYANHLMATKAFSHGRDPVFDAANGITLRSDMKETHAGQVTVHRSCFGTHVTVLTWGGEQTHTFVAMGGHRYDAGIVEQSVDCPIYYRSFADHIRNCREQSVGRKDKLDPKCYAMFLSSLPIPSESRIEVERTVEALNERMANIARDEYLQNRTEQQRLIDQKICPKCGFGPCDEHGTNDDRLA